MSRPSLKRRRVTSNRCEITVMQPVQHLLLLTHTRIPLTILTILPSPMPQCRLCSVFWRPRIIRLFPPATHEKHVPNLDVATLSSRANIYTLVFAALIKLFPRDGVVVERIVVDALLVGVASVVKKNSSSCNTVFSPMVDGAFVVCCWADDV